MILRTSTMWWHTFIILIHCMNAYLLAHYCKDYASNKIWVELIRIRERLGRLKDYCKAIRFYFVLIIPFHCTEIFWLWLSNTPDEYLYGIFIPTSVFFCKYIGIYDSVNELYYLLLMSDSVIKLLLLSLPSYYNP